MREMLVSVLAAAFILGSVSDASAKPKIATRKNFGCVTIADAADMLILERNRDDDRMVEIYRSRRCAQFRYGADLAVLERAERGGDSFLRVRISDEEGSQDFWFPEIQIRGSYADVPTRVLDEYEEEPEPNPDPAE